jgi:hypothetical protein
MPLSALADGQEVVATWLNDSAWDELGQAGLTAKCCGQRMHRRTSSRGLRHFVHGRRGDCTTAPESWQHLAAKAAVADAVRSSGWEASVETKGEGWVADVLATAAGQTPFAFEVQWTRQTPAEHQKRTKGHLDSGVAPVWLRRPRATDLSWGLAGGEYPRSFSLSVDDNAAIAVDGRSVSEVVAVVLRRQTVWRRAYPLQQAGTILVREYPYACPKCERDAVLPMWHTDPCCTQGEPSALRGPHPDSPPWRQLICKAQRADHLPNGSDGWYEPGAFKLAAKGRWKERTVYGWRCPSCRWVMQLHWCPCCAGIDELPDPPVGVWQLRCTRPTIAGLLQSGDSLAGPEHWCSSLVSPRTLA